MKINIKDLMEKKAISRYELAKRIGVTYPTITSIYNGDASSIKVETLLALCKELECTPNDIMEDELFPKIDYMLKDGTLIEVKRFSPPKNTEE